LSPTAIRRLRDVRLADAAEVGGKAASLGDLLAAGVRVPDGLVLGHGAGPLDADARRSLLEAVAAELGAGPFAVRSSGTAEDGMDHSYAGIYETVLDVSAENVPAAVDRVLRSARTERAHEYEPGGHGHMSVIIQRMIRSAAAGVVLTADPISGDRQKSVVTAVRGVGERLVSGTALGDEWVVRSRKATPRRRPEQAIDRRAAVRVASEATRIAAQRGCPQDIEWAIDADDALWVLQARPMTALPPDVPWTAPAAGAFTRALRFGEWISEPVTPLFESWLLSAMEERLHDRLRVWIGQHAPRPYHVVVNGWYFYSINWLGGPALVRSLPDILWHLVRSPRRVAGVIPPTARHSVPIFEREWREDLQPRYRAAVTAAEASVESLPVVELPSLIDELADLAGESFASIAALTGAAYKLEMNLARFYRRHLAASLGGSHLTLLAGFEPPVDPDLHAVASLDWWHAPPAIRGTATRPDDEHDRLVETRRAAEAAAFRALESSPRRLRAFRRLLAETQHLVPIREEQTRELTLPWPVMRRAVLRMGEALVERGALAEPADIFFLTRVEAVAAVRTGRLAANVDVAHRRTERAAQARLVPPLVVGRLNPMLRRVLDSFPKQVGAAMSERALVSGSPASPGRATGSVRVIRGPEAFDQLLPGEILVAPLTAPGWTPLFTRAGAVVTDVGSAASHASIIAREYGIPAIVGCGDATARLRTGMRVTVDGSTGNVEPE